MIEKILKRRVQPIVASGPEIFDMTTPADIRKIEALHKSHKDLQIVDEYEQQMEELFAIQNPSLVFNTSFKDAFSAYLKNLPEPGWKMGKWAYFPWLHTLV